MTMPKTYLTVPYAQKDAVKALGAKWDAVNKKWYVPANMDCTVFARWQPQTGTLESSPTISKPVIRKSSTTDASAKNTAVGIITQATDKNFVAYNGDEPPWD
ncbi:hypothetical protein KKZ03_11030 [Methylobacter sp. S3L5C]|nr:hypothetical protein KKZ03_11030 [Methylobacter sp. S3L5C]